MCFVYLNVIINDENRKKLDFSIVGITVWHFCCVATMQEYKQQTLTRQQEMLC